MNELPLQLKNLTKDYGSKRALDSVSLNIGAGERVGLVGPNGAGKTTLIKMIMGLIHPTAGSVKIYGREQNKLQPGDWAVIGYVADEPMLYDYMSPQKLIAFNRQFFPNWNQDRSEELLTRFHLPAGLLLNGLRLMIGLRLFVGKDF